MKEAETKQFHQHNNHVTRVMRRWLEEDIVGNKLCPPLVRVFNENRTQQKTFDWDVLEQLIAIQSYVHFTPSSEELIQAVVHDYVSFLAATTRGKAPLSVVFVLPKFTSNPEYELFMGRVKEASVASLVTEEGQLTLRNVTAQIADVYGRSLKTNTEMGRRGVLLNAGVSGQVLAASLLIENDFNPVYFYGRDITNQDLQDVSNERGKRTRQKILSLAPFYSMQVVNILERPNLNVSDKQALYRRNTEFALGMNPIQYGKRMNRLRNS